MTVGVVTTPAEQESGTMSSSCYIYDSESELAPFSPASSVSLMSVGSEPSPSPSPTSSDRCPRYRQQSSRSSARCC